MKNIQLSAEKAKQLFGKNTELDKILRENFSEEELGLKKPLPKSMDEVNTFGGWRCDFDGTPMHFGDHFTRKCYNMEQALSVDAYMQLTHAMKAYNGDWEPDWNDKDQTKHVIIRFMNVPRSWTSYMEYYFLAFPTEELRDEFMKNFEPLIKTFYQI